MSIERKLVILAFHARSTFMSPSSAPAAVVSELRGNFDELIQQKKLVFQM